MADYYGGRTMYSNTDECYDVGRHGSRRMYSHTDESFNDEFDRRRPAYADNGYGGRQTAVYATDEYSRGGYGGEQQYYRREERKEHKNHERLGEVGALASGAFALYEGHRAKTDPEHKQKHMIEAGLAGAAALGAGGYAYQEHREETRYEGNPHNRVPHGQGYYSN